MPSEARRTEFPLNRSTADEVRSELASMLAADLDPVARMAWGTHYVADPSVTELVEDVYRRCFWTNAMAAKVYPSLGAMEQLVVGQVADLLHATRGEGSVTSGGSESILMGIKSARDRARVVHPEVSEPEIVIPASAHPAHLKAAHYFGIKPVVVPLTSAGHVPMDEYRAAIGRNTVALVGSAPSLTLGMVDPIEEMGALAQARDINLHVDACVGGFFLPFLEGVRAVPLFDFRVPGVSTISADLHKFGYAAKGTSVIVSRDPETFSFQTFEAGPPFRRPGWYRTPSMTGTRPGASIAAAWAVLRYLGMSGFREIARDTMAFTEKLQAGIRSQPEVEVAGEPVMTVFSVVSGHLNMLTVADELSARGWLPARETYPFRAIKYMQCLGQAPYLDAYLADFREAVLKASNMPFTVAEGTATYN